MVSLVFLVEGLAQDVHVTQQGICGMQLLVAQLARSSPDCHLLLGGIMG